MKTTRSSLFQTPFDWSAVGLAYSSMFALGLADNIRGPLFPDVMQGLRLNDNQGSWLWAASSLMAFAGAMMAPRVMKIRGEQQTLLLSMLGMAGSQFVMALSGNLILGILSSVLLGLSFGLLGVVQNVFVLRAGPRETHSRLQSGLHSNYAFSSLMAPLLVVAAAWLRPGWRFGYVIGGVCSCLGLLIAWQVIRNKGAPKDQQISEPVQVKETQAAHEHHFSPLAGIWLGVMIGLYVTMEILVSSRLALFARRELSSTLEESSFYTMLFFAGMLIGRVLFIFWRPKTSLKFQMTLCLSGSFVCLLLGLFWRPEFLGLSGFAMAPFYPLSMAYLAENFPHALVRVMSLGIAMGSAMIVLMHLSVGYMTETIGIRSAMLMGPAAALVSLVLLHTHHFSARLSRVGPWAAKS